MRFARFIAAVFLLALPTGALSAVCSPYAYTKSYLDGRNNLYETGWHIVGQAYDTKYWLYGDANAQYKTPNRVELLATVRSDNLASECGVSGATSYSLRVFLDLVTGKQSATIELSGQNQTLATYTGSMSRNLPKTYHYTGGFRPATDITLGFSSFTNLETGDVLFPNGFRLMACAGEGVFQGGTKVVPGYGYFFCSGDFVDHSSPDPNVIESWSIWKNAAIMPVPLPNSVSLSLTGFGLLGFLRHLAGRRRIG